MKKLEIFPWNSSFEVGVEKVDTDHKNLVRLINEICSSVIYTDQYEEIIDSLFKELIEYTLYHFNNEEEYYKQNFLPETLFNDHKKTHDKLISDVGVLKEKYDNDMDSDINTKLEEILKALVLWLTNHILGDDMTMCMIVSNINKGMSEIVAQKDAELQMKGAKGTIRDTMFSMMSVFSSGVMALRREITHRKKLEEELVYMAQHDALTGLSNRILFMELANKFLKNAKRNKIENAVFFVDIDGFKEINDVYGHSAGDALLVSIAERLEKCVRESDIVARMGGDEFTVYLSSNSKISDVRNIASKIVESISRPFKYKKNTATVSASVGISIYPADGDNVETLIKRSDEAMYAAKTSGKNNYKFFHEI